MSSVRVIFQLNDGTEVEGKDKIDKILYLYPKDIIKKKEHVFKLMQASTVGWNTSVLKVFQNGEHEVILNIPPDIPFSLDV